MRGNHQVSGQLMDNGNSVDSRTILDNPQDGLRKKVFGEILSWMEEEGSSHIVGGKDNRLVSCVSQFPINNGGLMNYHNQNATHPLTNLTITHTEGIASHFYGQMVPPRVLRKPAA